MIAFTDASELCHPLHHVIVSFLGRPVGSPLAPKLQTISAKLQQQANLNSRGRKIIH